MATLVTRRGTQRRVGLIRAVWYAFFGEPDETQRELKRAASHGALALVIGRMLATPLMVMFSVGALVTLAGEPLAHNLALLRAHQPLDIVSLLGTAVTVVFVLSMDVSMIIASIFRRVAKSRGATWRETFTLNLLIWGVGALEAATFISMVASYEHPASYWQWALAIARGVFAPPIAIFLASAEKPVVTDRDIQHLLQQRSGQGLLALLDERLAATEPSERPDMAQLFGLFTFVRSPLGATRTERDDWYKNVMSILEKMSPDSLRAQHARELEALRAQSERAINAARAEAQHARDVTQRDIEAANTEAQRVKYDAQRLIAEAQRAAGQRVSEALLAFVSTGALPSWLTDERPELASLTRESLLGQLNAANTSTSRPRAPRRMAALSSRADRMRAALAELDIDEARRPADVSRGVFVATSALARLVDEQTTQLSLDELRRLMNDANGGQVRKSGTSLVAPVDRVIAELRRLHLLSERADGVWTRLVDSANDSDTNDESHSEGVA